MGYSYLHKFYMSTLSIEEMYDATRQNNSFPDKIQGDKACQVDTLLFL